jgi:hypothetical protein
MKITNLLLVVGAAALVGFAGCEKKEGTNAAGNLVNKAAEGASKAADSATKAAGDAAKAAGDATKAAAEGATDAAKAAADTAKDAAAAAKDAGGKAVDAAKEGAAKAGDMAKEGLAKLQAEGKKWIDETVTKQWPDMKKGLDEASKKVASIADAGKKTQAEGLVKDLQAKVPAMEKLVGDLTNFKDGDFGKLFNEAKSMWDGFGTKMADLKKLLPA